MSDPRMTPTNGRVAHSALNGVVEAEAFTDGTWQMVQQPIANLASTPGDGRASQLVFGEHFLVLDTEDGFAFGQAARDGYVGYLPQSALVDVETPTHWVIAPASHLYPKPDIKAAPEVSLYFGSQVRVIGQDGAFRQIHTGHFMPEQHLMPIAARFSDPIGIADLFLGTPYLWGGNCRWGMDCSGLVQTVLLACGIDCPRDSDQQQEALGTDLDPDEPLKRGDLIFWNGHVGMMANDAMLLHANGHHMAVAYEPFDGAVARIAQDEYGEVIARKRITLR